METSQVEVQNTRHLASQAFIHSLKDPESILEFEPTQDAPHGIQVVPSEEIHMNKERVKVVEVAAPLEEAGSYAPDLLITLEERLAKGVEEAYEG